jgi:hypothetical protein
MMPQTIGGSKQMSDEDEIWVDASQPATLIDGDKPMHCPTPYEAKMAWDRLPTDRKAAAKIKCHKRVFTPDEIDRLYNAGPYEAELLDALDTTVHDSDRMNGPDDDEAGVQALEWAKSHKIDREVKLSLKQGSSRGILHVDISLSSTENGNDR